MPLVICFWLLTLNSNSMSHTMGEGFPVAFICNNFPRRNVHTCCSGVGVESGAGLCLRFEDNVPDLILFSGSTFLEYVTRFVDIP